MNGVNERSGCTVVLIYHGTLLGQFSDTKIAPIGFKNNISTSCCWQFAGSEIFTFSCLGQGIAFRVCFFQVHAPCFCPCHLILRYCFLKYHFWNHYIIISILGLTICLPPNVGQQTRVGVIFKKNSISGLSHIQWKLRNSQRVGLASQQTKYTKLLHTSLLQLFGYLTPSAAHSMKYILIFSTFQNIYQCPIYFYQKCHTPDESVRQHKYYFNCKNIIFIINTKYLE